MNYSERQQTEADSLGISVQRLRQSKQDVHEIEEARRRGTDVWELRMRKDGSSKEQIDKERARQSGTEPPSPRRNAPDAG